jgi:hypothetical protein
MGIEPEVECEVFAEHRVGIEASRLATREDMIGSDSIADA